MNNSKAKFQENKEALKENIAKAFEKAFIEMGDKAKEIDWFVCNRFPDKK